MALPADSQPILTRPEEFQDVSRGSPKSHSLNSEELDAMAFPKCENAKLWEPVV